MTQVPPNDIPDLRQRLDRMASDIDELKRRRIDFPTDEDPDCKGCICQANAVGVSSSNATVNLGSGGGIAQPFNTLRTTDCSQGGGLLGSDSSSIVAIKAALWIVDYQVFFTHSGAGLRSAKVVVQNPPEVTTPHTQHVAGVPETAATEQLVMAGCFATFMYAQDYLSFTTTGYAASGTYDVTIAQHVSAAFEFPFDSF